ncbi:hypothetical protein Cni_G06354 [Canna indica]|uniref:Uncharacterized protein n=1 Tax=Canna indica TaxID=4628 RepID=A0AAQ3K047_9LILI|nr:hypothetical protein Cni_G06354 [Canna indica]
MTGALFSPMPSSPHFPGFSSFRRISIPYRAIGFAALVHAHRALAVRAATESSAPVAAPAPVPTTDDVAPRGEQEDANKKSRRPSKLPLNLPFCIPTWARWILGSVVLLAFPYYKKILRLEDKLEKTASAVAHVIEKVAEATEKISEEVAEALPEDSKLRKIALGVEHLAERVADDAEKAEELIKKVDGVVDRVDHMVVEPIVKEAAAKGGHGRRQA